MKDAEMRTLLLFSSRDYQEVDRKKRRSCSGLTAKNESFPLNKYSLAIKEELHLQAGSCSNFLSEIPQIPNAGSLIFI